MKKLFLLFLIVFSSQSFAGDPLISNQDCIDAYRTGYINLEEYIRRFNDGSYNRFEMSTAVSANSTILGGIRTACLAFENPSVGKCVKAYKELYTDLRDNVKLGAILMGNQTEITYSKKMQQVIEEVKRDSEGKTGLGRLFQSLRIGIGALSETVQRAKDITMLEFVDAKCGN